MIIEDGVVYGICDIDRIEFMQKQTVGYGEGWIFRHSLTGRGMRLHETSSEEASPTVREAIDSAIRAAALADNEGPPIKTTWQPVVIDPMAWTKDEEGDEDRQE